MNNLNDILALYQAFGPQAEAEQQFLQNQLAMQEAELNEQNSGFDQVAQMMQLMSMMQGMQPDPLREAQTANFEADTARKQLEVMHMMQFLQQQGQMQQPQPPGGYEPDTELLQLFESNPELMELLNY